MNCFLEFCTSAEQLTHIKKNAIAASLSLGLVTLCGWGIASGTENGSEYMASSALGGSTLAAPNKPLTEKQALALFEAVADDKTIPFESYNNGCFSRAEKMRQIIESKGIPVQKIWAFKDSDHQLHFQEPSSRKPRAYWKSHVAVALNVIDSNGVKNTYVFDPSIFDAPARISEWAAKINANPYKVELTKPDIYPARFWKLVGRTRVTYTRRGYDIAIALQFKNYFNAGSVRKVYSAKLRDKLCITDSSACKKRGATWQTVIHPSLVNS